MNHPMLRFCYAIPARCIRRRSFAYEFDRPFHVVEAVDRTKRARSWTRSKPSLSTTESILLYLDAKARIGAA